ncbi:MAG: triple tyrosine motif-containing protein [Dehalococcoidia bacterium]|nr:triple tyrosine motif-containing protein [Dehalococcoidia bacterium]
MQKSQPPDLPASPSPSILPSGDSPRFSTAILEGPVGTINYNTVTFRWGSSLSSVDPSNFMYATFLDGWDKDYTPFLTDTSRSFSNLPNGSYKFYVKTQDLNGNIDPATPSQSFVISGVIPPQAQALPVTPGGDGGLLLIGADVSRIAVGGDGSTVYALDSTSSRLYRSTSAGVEWRDISSALGAGAPWIDLAVAPDDPGFIAVVTAGGSQVHVSTDGGATFQSTDISSHLGAGQAVRCIAISPGYGSPRRELAVGTWNGAAGGSVLINIMTGFSGGWFNAGSGMTGWAPPGGGGVDVAAISYSPSYGSDGALLLVTSSAAKTYLYAGERDIGSNSITWNSWTGYPVEIGQAGEPLNHADIALPSDYSGSNPYSRRAFASWNKNNPGRDVYQVSDYQVYRMNAPEAIASIAYYGRISGGKLLAGAVKCQPGGCYQVQTYFTANPTSMYPAWLPSQKAPTGSRNAMVEWATNGTIAYAGTSGTESAFSHSLNDGTTWNQ